MWFKGYHQYYAFIYVQKHEIEVARPITIILQLDIRSIYFPQGKTQDVLVRNDNFVFHVDFIIMDFSADEDTLILLMIPFLVTEKY